MVGITSLDEEKEGKKRENSRVVRVEDVCEVVAAAEKKMKDAMPPGAAPLPVEPVAAVPADATR